MTYREWWKKNNEEFKKLRQGEPEELAPKFNEWRRKNMEKDLPPEKREKLKYDWLVNTDSTLPLPRRMLQLITVVVSVVAYIIVANLNTDMLWLYKAAVVILGSAMVWFWWEYDRQHRVNPLERCPHCRNEEGIKHARHGYDFGKAATWELLGGGDAGRYIAGEDINKTDCHCPKCGYTWTVDVDYRFLDD